MNRIPTADILKLSVEERFDLLERIWETITAEPDPDTLAEADLEELDRRLAELIGDPDATHYQ